MWKSRMRSAGGNPRPSELGRGTLVSKMKAAVRAAPAASNAQILRRQAFALRRPALPQDDILR